MADSVFDEYQGVRFKVDAIAQGELFVGRFELIGGMVSGASGTDDSYRPTLQNAWATPQEAVTYATEAAHHAIDGIEPFTDVQAP
ncbi:hypothetical protein [Roseateles sp.]|uniref:hypothetical protein n=1 Tax=Roseateles sp. TaxID=1971397 RepID=UPI003267CC80